MTYMVISGLNLMKIRRIIDDLYIFGYYYFDCNYANQKWLEMVKMWQRFKEWLIIRQSAKFAKELKEKGYKPRKPWNVGIWK